MSLNIVPLPEVRTMDPRLVVNNPRAVAIMEGPMDNNYQVFPASTFNSSQVTITCNPPNEKIIVSRKVLLRMIFRIVLTAPAPLAQNVYDPAFMCPRQYPISQVLTTLGVNINNDTVTQNLNQYWNAFLRYKNDREQREYDYSMTPSELDQAQEYSHTFNSNRDPMARYGSQPFEQSRGSFKLSILANSTSSATLLLDCTEVLWISPLIFGGQDKSGMVGINTMNVNLTLGNLARVWSFNKNNTIYAGFPEPSVTVDPQPQLLFNYLTPDITSPIPAAVSYNYSEPVVYLTNAASVGPLASAIIPLNNVQLKAIPESVYLFVREQDMSLTSATSDAFFNISNVNVQWSNRSGILAQASEMDLWRLSTRNGCKITWPQWNGTIAAVPAAPSTFVPPPLSSGPGMSNETASTIFTGVGSVIKLDFARDIGLASSLESPGMLGNYQFQCSVTCKNLNRERAILPSLYAVFVHAGSFSIINGSCLHQVGLFTPQDVLNSKSKPLVPFMDPPELLGGNAWDWIKKAAKSAWPYIKGAAEVASVVAPFTKLIGAGKGKHHYRSRGMGRHGGLVLGSGRSGGMVMGGHMDDQEEMYEGGDFDESESDEMHATGGRMVSRAALRKRMQ